MASTPSDLTCDAIADRLLSWAISTERIRGLWLEGRSIEEIRRPYRALQAHLAADEPEFPALIEELPQALSEVADAKVVEVRDTRRFAKEFRLDSDGTSWTLIVEQTSLLAKRPRAHVAALLDRTDHLTHVMDYSLRTAP